MSNNNNNQQTPSPDESIAAAAKAQEEAEARKAAEAEAAKKAEEERIAAEKRSAAAKKAAETRRARAEAAKATSAPVNGKTDEELAQELLAGTSPAMATDVNAQGSRKNLLDTLHEMFRPTAMVIVKNFTDFDTGWVYSDPNDLVTEQPDKYTRRDYPGQPRARVLRAGAQIVVQGWEAYIGLTRFFKQYAQLKGGKNISAFMNSQAEHRKFLAKAYGGIFDPNNGLEDEVDARTALENDLGLTDGGNA